MLTKISHFVIFLYTFIILNLFSIAGHHHQALAAGPTSTGGANGAENKVFESNVISLKKLTIYPRLESFMNQFDLLWRDNTDAKSNKFSASKFLFSWKLWFFTDSELNPIDKETLGVIFTKDNPQQIAVNYNKEIWINQKIFNQMNESEQYDLIIHEFTMNLYFLKFYTYYDICNISAELDLLNKDSETQSCEQIKRIKYLNKKAAMILNSDDYQNIRRVADWLIKNIHTATQEQLYNKLLYNNFDKRFMPNPNKKNSDQPNSKIELNGSKIITNIKESYIAENFPDMCLIDSETNEKTECHWTISNQKNDLGDYDELSLNIPKMNLILKFNLDFLKINTISASHFEETEYYTAYLGSNSFPIVPKTQIGDKFYILKLYFINTGFTEDQRIKQTKLQLGGVFLSPFVVTDFSKKYPHFSICSIKSLNPKKYKSISWSLNSIIETLLNYENEFFIDSFNEFYCTQKTDADLSLIKKEKQYQKDLLTEHIGKSFQFNSISYYSGEATDKLKLMSKTKSEDYIKNINCITENSSGNNNSKKEPKCQVISKFKILSLTEVLINDEFKCQIQVYPKQAALDTSGEIKQYTPIFSSNPNLFITCNQDGKYISLLNNNFGDWLFMKNNLIIKNPVYKTDQNKFIQTAVEFQGL